MEKHSTLAKQFFYLFLILCHISVQAITVSPNEKLEAPLLDNINAHLSVYPAPDDCVISQHFHNKLTVSLKKALQGFGYYQFDLQEFSPISPENCGEWQILMDLGPRTKIANIDIKLTGDGEQDGILTSAIASFPLQVGGDLNHKGYENGKSLILNTATLHGYFDFRFDLKELLVLPKHNEATIKLYANTGKRYRFGMIRGDVDDDILNIVHRMQTFKIGDFYDAEKLNELVQQLKQTGFFEQVSLRPMIASRQEDTIPLFLTAKQKPNHIVNLGAGASSDTGPRATINWQRPRLNKDGHSVETELFLSGPEQSAALNYKIPLKNPTKNFLTLQLGIKSTDDNDTRSDTISLAVKRHWSWSQKEWNNIAFLRYDQESFTQGEQDRLNTALLIPGMTVSRLRNDGSLDPAWGDRQIITIEGASQSALSDINLLRISIQSRWLRSFSKHRLFWRGDIGAIATNDFTRVPSSLRYFAGGDQSVRGFGYQSLAPVDQSDQLLGGKYLYSTSLEYSYALNESWRAAAFADIGNASNQFLKDPATGIGLGVHWSTIIGPIRLYLARGNSEFESTWRIHFAMGASL